jgi:uncharacterized membrane protein YkvA (DUF1232 family)
MAPDLNQYAVELQATASNATRPAQIGGALLDAAKNAEHSVNAMVRERTPQLKILNNRSTSGSMIDRWKQWARTVKRDAHALYLAARDPRVPWYAKALAAAVAAYAASPIDLIPDFIPVIGYLDDLIIVPLGIVLVIKLIPPEIMAECHALATAAQNRPASWTAAIFVAIWIAAIFLCVGLIYHFAK